MVSDGLVLGSYNICPPLFQLHLEKQITFSFGLELFLSEAEIH